MNVYICALCFINGCELRCVCGLGEIVAFDDGDVISVDLIDINKVRVYLL